MRGNENRAVRNTGILTIKTFPVKQRGHARRKATVRVRCKREAENTTGHRAVDLTHWVR